MAVANKDIVYVNKDFNDIRGSINKFFPNLFS